MRGGGVCYRDKALVQLLDDLKNFGIRSPEEVAYIGGNAKMSEFQAAMGICNLRHLDAEIVRRKTVVEHYRQHLSNIKGIRLCQPQLGVTPNYAYFPVVFDGYKLTRNEVCNALAQHNIIARKYFYPLINAFKAYKHYPTADVTKTPVARHISEKVVTLPLYPDLALEEVDRICELITK